MSKFKQNIQMFMSYFARICFSQFLYCLAACT